MNEPPITGPGVPDALPQRPAVAAASPPWFAEIWTRIKEHKVIQWGVGYFAAALALAHAQELIAHAYQWPEIVGQILIGVLVLGFLVALVLAWYHGHKGLTSFSKAEMSILAALLIVGAGMVVLFVKPVEHATTAATPAAVQSAVTPRPGGVSVAVLPFVNLSGDPAQEFFSDGMTEEITSALAKVSGLTVIGRTSAFAFKGEKKDLRTIGKALNASHLIDGSVKKDGNEVRITAQLIKADDGTLLWTESYNRELKGVFAVQEEIATAIAGALRVPLGLKTGQSLVANRTADAESYQDYLRAKALVRARGLKPLTDGAALLEQVVARDPNYAPAWALLASAYVLKASYDPGLRSGSVAEARSSVEVNMPRAETAARRAIELDPSDADGYASLGFVQDFRSQHLAAAETFSKALTLDPQNPEALHYYSMSLAAVGRPKEALAVRLQLQASEPFVPVFNRLTALTLWLNGQNDAAVDLLKVSDPGLRATYRAMIYAATGRYREAADALLETPPDTFLPSTVETAASLLRTAPAAAATPQSLPRLGLLGFVFIYIGAPERSLEFYEGNLAVGFDSGAYSAFLWHPAYSAVRKTERFKAYARAAGLVAYWRAKGWPEFCHPTAGDDFVCK